MLDLWQFCMVAETAWRALYDLAQPFSRERYTYATNGHIIVRVPRIVEDAEGTLKVENLTAHITHANLAPLPVVECADPETCHICKGFGAVRPCRVCNEGCKRCDGWGYVPARKPHEDQETCYKCEGRKVIWPEHYHIWLTPRMAIAPRYYRMLAALPGIRIDLTVDCVTGTWKQDRAMKGISFAFDGGDGLLMPIRIMSPKVAEAA